MKRDSSLKAWRENINSPGGLRIEGRGGEGREGREGSTLYTTIKYMKSSSVLQFVSSLSYTTVA